MCLHEKLTSTAIAREACFLIVFAKMISTKYGEIKLRNLKKKNQKISTSTRAVVALMTAVVCVLAPFSIPVGVIPVSLATFGLYLAVQILGGKKAVGVCLMYLLIGFVGLPVFSGFTGGPAKILGPTGGYLAGYLLLTGIAGFFVDKFPGKRVFCLLGFVFGTIACYVVGTIWLAVQMKVTFGAALLVGVVPFLPGDVLKMIVASWLGEVVRRRVQRLGYIE